MSKVTQVTVRYGRSVQPKPYESKEGLLEAVIVADEGEDVSRAEVEALFGDLISNVHMALDLPMRDPVANSTDEPPKKTGKTRRTKKQIAEDKAAEQDKAEAAAAATSGDPHPADDVPVEGDEAVEDTGDSTTEGVSDQELQSAAAAAAAKHGAAKVKDLMKEFDVTLLGRLGQKAREMFMVKLDKLDA